MKDYAQSLVAVLEDTRRLIELPGNDFAWSSWRDKEEALAEIDRHLAKAKTGDQSLKFELEVIFAPTGPLQELSLSSGWSDDFLKLAARLDTLTSSSQTSQAEPLKRRG